MPDAAAQPPWVPIPRGDWLRLVYGLPLPQAGAWSLLLAEALADGQASLPIARCAEVGGQHWAPLRERLLRSGRIAINDNLVFIPWIADRLADADRRIAKGRERVGNRQDRRRE